jgi:hypothetical protein
MQHKWRTVVLPAYKRRLILKASIGGGFGVSFLVATGTFMPLSDLQIWGLPIFAASTLLIAWSLRPYQKIVQMENTPDELWTDARGNLVYAKRKIPLLTIPLAAIKNYFYIDKPKEYGIAITIKAQPKEKIRVHNNALDFRAFQQVCIQQQGCDLFLPFFSKRVFDELQEYLSY